MPLDDAMPETGPPPPEGFSLVAPPAGFSLVPSGGEGPPPPPGFAVAPTAPSYTREKPFLPTTQEDAERFFKTAPVGSIAKHPKTGEMFEVPPPSAEPAATPEQEAIDLGGAGGRALPKPPGIFGTAIEAGRKGIVSGFTEAAQAPTAFRDRPPEAPDTSPVGELLSEPISKGWADPKWWVAHIVHGAAASAPSLATGAAGAFAGSAAGSVVPGIGTAAGALAGGAGGFALGSAMQTIAPAYQKARADGLDHDTAVTRALETSGIAAAFGGAMGVAPIFAPLKGAVSNALLQIFAAQPALGLGQMAATGALEGKTPTLDELGTAYAEQAGMGAALVGGHAAARRLMGQPAHLPGPTEPTAAPAAPAGPTPAVPPVGSVIGMDLGTGARPATVSGHTPEGDVILTDPDGGTHRMTGADVAKYGAALPDGTPPPPPAEPAQRTTMDINGQRVVDTTGPVPTPDAVRNAQERGETITTPTPPPSAPPEPRAQTRTQADLEREDAEMRAAVASPAGIPGDPLADQLAKVEAEIAQNTIPRGTEAPQPPPAPPPAPVQQAPAIDLSGMGRGMSDNLYAGLLDALTRGSDTFAGVRDPAIARAKPFFDAGLIKSPEDLRALVQAGYDPVRAGLQPPSPAPQPIVPGGAGPVADIIRDNVARSFDLAGRLGVVDDTARLAAEGKTAAQVATELGPRLDQVRAIARANGENERAASEQFVREVRLGLGIPSLDNTSEFNAWRDAYAARQTEAAPPAAPLSEPPDANTPASNTDESRIPSVGGAPATPPVVEPVPAIGVPEAQAPRPAGTRLELTESDDQKLARLSALEAENTAPEQGGFVRRLEAEQAADAEAAPPEQFDVEKFDRERAERIAASRAAGNTHLDEIPPYVETMRGKEIYYAHDPKVRGTVRSVANTGEVVVDWRDAYSQQKELGAQTWLGPNDLKDYVVARPEAPAAPSSESPSNTPTVSDEVHTKTQKPIFAVRFPEKPDIPDLGGNARRMGGQWSSYRGQGMTPGWMFKTREAADRFAAWATEKLGADETPAGSSLGPASADLIPEYRKILEDYAAAGHTVWVQRSGGTLRVRLDGRAPQSPVGAVADVRAGSATIGTNPRPAAPSAPQIETPRAPEIPRGTEDLPEHPGLVVQSLETGRRDVIQPPGTRPPGPRDEAPPPPRKDVWGRYVDDYGSPQVDSGERLRTVSGLITEPAPKFDITDGKSAMRAFRRVDAWLVDQAKQEVDVPGNENVRPFILRLDPKNLSPADRDMANEVLWGDTRPTDRNRIPPGSITPGGSQIVREPRAPDQFSAEGTPEELGLPEPRPEPIASNGVDDGYVPSGMDPELYRMRQEVARAAQETDEATEGQKESGNYKKGRVNFHGIPFVMENPAGSYREGVSRDGERWSVKLPVDYGYVSKTLGADGDHVDAYLGHDLLSQKAWIIDQADAETGRFDEHKVMLGFADWRAAREAYLDAFSDDRGEERIGQVTPMSLDEVKDWLATGDTKNPIGQTALSFDGKEPTLPTGVPVEETGNGVQGTLPSGDAGAGAEDVRGASPPRPAGSTRPAEEPRGAGNVPRPDEGAQEPGAGGAPPGGGDRPGDPDRVPAGADAAGQPGTAGGSAGAGGERPPAGRVPDLDEPRPLGEPKQVARAVDLITGQNHVIEPGTVAEERTPRIKARDNIAAIELAKALITDGRPATKEEQAILARYVGWGGLANAFPDPKTGLFRKPFEDVGARLKQLLTPDEYRTAARSTQYAHYTSEPVIRAMWNAVERMGFKGGSILEPGMGIGHFLGMMPPDLAAKSKYQGLELDHLTAQIARLLYPESGVRQGDFTRTKFPIDTFDLAIGNPPFGDITIRSDPKYAARGFLLHDYFFAKSLDSVRPGGLMGFVTSAGTMNKLDPAARQYLAERAEFVGGVRLPSTAFAKNAGTEVTTDILFFKKRPTPIEVAEGDAPWTDTVKRTLPDVRGVPTEGNVNRYFAEHPEMVLGEEGFFDKLYKGRYAVHETPGTVLADRLSEAFERLPENVMDPPMSPEQKAALDFSATEKKEGSFYVAPDGRLMQYSEGAGRPVARRGAGVEGGKTGAEVETIRQLLPIRDALRDVFRHDLSGDAEAGADARAALNRVYDNFVKKNGPINKAEFSYRRPSIVQQENARAEAREEAREIGDLWDEGTFDPTEMIARKAKATEIARARENARQQAKAAGREFDEGSFDPNDMPDIVVAKRPNIDPFQDDQESYRLRALENYDDATGESSKRRVFYENTLTREEEPQLNSAQDGILWSMNKHGRLDIDAIAEKLGVDKNQVIDDLGDQVMRVPGTEEVYEPRDAYLSGDVVSKLAEAKAAAERDPRFQKNVSALEAAQPAPLSPAEIAMNIGMPWIPPETMHAFADSIGIGRTDISYSPLLGRWVVDTRNAARGPRDAEWSTGDFNAHELLAEAMNGKTPVVRITDKGPPQVTWVDTAATQAAQDKVNAIKEAFATWAQADPERAHQMAEIYNGKYNRVVLRQWNGDYLTTPGVSADWHWRPHQTRVVARIIQDGNTYMAHAVGAGKTSAMIGAGMEMRRLGLVNKPMYVVPNHMLGQFAKEFYEQYPTARIAVADDRNFHTSRRKQFVANVAQQDLDAVIITNSAFKKVPISQEFGEKLIREATDEIDEALRQLGQDPSNLKSTSRDVDQADRVTVKQLQKKKERLEQKLLSVGGDQDVVNTFEEMGVDFLFVDEAHQFRKLSFVTQTPMKGITSEGSDMAWDLYTKIRYLDENRPGRSLVMASGTPVTNTMGELYSLSRYMQPQALKERGLSHFDSWRQAFADTKTDIEQTATGAYEPVTRLAKFVNMPELYKMVGSNMDVVTSEQLAQYVTRPELEGGKRDFHLAPRTNWLENFQRDLASRVEAIKKRRGPPSKGDDILLSVINDGRKGAIDPRLVDPGAPNEPSSKLNQMIDNVHRIWAETKNQPFYDPATNYEKEIMRGPATQMVFSNLGINGGEGKFSAYDAMRREWVRRGIPVGEIAFIKDYTTPVAKQRLLNDVNDGKVRILVGSTQKMGTGINAQKRLAAIHNLDPLWYPADDEQRNGRGLRQGNLNPRLQIHDYSTKGTYDSTMWAMMGRKGRFIEQFFRGDPNLREMEDLGEASQYEQAAAMATSDERVIKLTEMRQELQKLERRQQAHANEQYTLKYRAGQAESDAQYAIKAIAETQDAMARAQDISGDKFQMKVGPRTYTERKAAADAISKAIETVYPQMGNRESRLVGEIGGFPLSMESSITLDRDANGKRVEAKGATPIFRVHFGDDWSTSLGSVTGPGVIQSASGYIRDLPNYLTMHQGRLADAQARAETNRNAMGRPFTEGDKIDPLRQQIRDLEAAMSAPPAPPIEPTQMGVPGQMTELGEAGRMAAPEDLRPTTGRAGVAEEPSPALIDAARSMLAGGERDLRDDYAQFRGDSDPHLSARDWTLQKGAETGFEHLVAHAGDETHAGTAGLKNAVAFSPDLLQRLSQEDAGGIVHHNHPGGNSLSSQDVKQLALPGLDTIIAHAGEDAFVARLTPEAKMWAVANPDQADGVLGGLYRDAAAPIVRKRLQGMVDQGKLTPEQAAPLHADIVNRALDAAGVLDYVSSRSTAPLPEFWAKGLIREAATQTRKVADAYGIPTPEEGLDARVYRSTLTVRPEESLGRLSGGVGEDASGRPGRDAGESPGREGTGEDEGLTPGLAEERPDFTDEAQTETVDAALRAGGPKGYGAGIDNVLGVAPNSPGVKQHDFNIVNKLFTTMQTKAALDTLVNAKWQPELAKKRLATSLFNSYKDMPSWRGITPEDTRELFSVMELATLDGREMPLDGRAIIIENRDHPLAALSKPGDVPALRRPEQIQRFIDLRQTMDQVWKDQVAGHAERIGWTGEPTAEAIYKAAADAGESREGRQLKRMARLLAGVEMQHKTAYLPLMRQGEYFLRVTPKAGTADKPGIPGWTGDGYAPTTLFKTIDPLTWLERARGGMREGTPKLAAAAIADLRTQFPEAEYDIQHGYLFKDADTIAGLRIPAIEKLMMLSGNDAQGLLRDNYTRLGLSGDDARAKAKDDYEKITDGILDEIWAARVPGFKKQRQGIPGYDGDFNRSIGRYLSWLSNSTARLKYGREIEAADEALLHHPDQRTRDYVRDWNRAMADHEDDQIYGPLMKLRQAAFYTLLGGNAATSLKIMLHAPLRGMPILGTGLGPLGRAQAAGEYLKALASLGGALRIGKNGIELDYGTPSFDRGLSPEERAMFKRALADGVIHEQTADEMRAMGEGGEQALTDNQRFFRRVLDIWSSNVSAADRMVRGGMMLGAYRTAARVGMPAIDRVWDRNLNWKNGEHTPEAFARFMVDQTVGVWGQLNRMPIARSQLGGMAFQFKIYESGYLSNLHSMLTKMGPEGKWTAALMLGGLGMMGGVSALPFAQDIEKATAAVWQMITGIAPDLEDELRQIFDQVTGGAGETLVHGPRFGGVDWSSIGFGDILSRNAQSPLDLAGAAVSTFTGGPYRAYERLNTGQGLLAASQELIPNAGKHMLQALYPEITEYPASGTRKIQKASEISDADRFKIGLGLKPEAGALNYEKFRRDAHLQASYRQGLTLAENRIANLSDRGESTAEALAQATKLIADGAGAGVFTQNEAARFAADLKRKAVQRANPQLGSRAQQRIEAVRQPLP